MGAGDRFADARLLLIRFSFRLEQVPIKHVVNQRRLAGTGNAGHAIENAERDFDVDILQVMLASPGDSDGTRGVATRFGNWDAFFAEQIIACQRSGSASASRAGDGALAIANFVRGRLFWRGAETSTR